MRGFGKILLMACGLVCVALGALGLVLPVLPTTPFLLLAAFCFSKSSDRLHRWLHDNPWFGKTLRDYREGRGVPPRAKALAMATLWPAIGVATVLIPLWPVRILVVAVAAAVTVHILRLPNVVGADASEA